ncbi:MAG: hypothetical protein FWC81_01155 [Coriobacteriia bacterium]|nr:hypothetical protein [Coriobacteriia bacterium]
MTNRINSAHIAPRWSTSGRRFVLLLIVACVMVLPAIAAATPTPPNPPLAPAITKVLRMPERTITPTTNFEFSIAPHSFNGGSIPPAPFVMPQLNNQPIPFSPADTGTTAGGVTTVSKAGANLFTGVTFPQIGTYTYRITERNDTFTNTFAQIMEFDTTTWQITIQVLGQQDPTDDLFVSSVIVQRVLPNGDLDSDKSGPITFDNRFTRRVNDTNPTDPDQAGLLISKAVQGSFGDTTHFFDFSVSVTAPQIAIDLTTGPITYRAFVVENGAVVTSTDNGAPLAGPAGGDRYFVFTPGIARTIHLRHGQTLVFVDTHIGARYNVSEINVPIAYAPSAVVTADGQSATGSPFTANLGQDLVIPQQVLGEARNSAAFVNAHNFIEPTGLTVGALGSAVLFVGLIAVTIVAGMIYSKRRRAALKAL